MNPRKKLITALLLSFFIPFSLGSYFVYQKFNTPESFYYQIGCQLFSMDFGFIKKYPGDNCLFLPDGRMVRFEFNNIEYFDSKMASIWKKNVETHHPPAFSNNRQVIYFLSNQYENFNGVMTRFDKVVAMELKSGRILHSWNSNSMKEELETAAGWIYDKEKQVAIWGNNPSNVKYDFFHFNSIYEIPKNKLSNSVPYLKEGNIIVSAGISLLLFFDPELKLIKISRVDDYQGIQFHDAQITTDGNILLYRNYQSIAPEQSSIEIFEPVSMQLTFEYPKDPVVSKFYSHCCGGVQILDNGHFLFNDLTEGGRFQEIDSDGEVYKTFTWPEIDPKTNEPYEFFNVKKVNLKKYFLNAY